MKRCLSAICCLAVWLAFAGESAAQDAAAGTLDVSFGEDGKAVATLADYTSQAFAMDIQSDGKILLAGTAWQGSNDCRMVLARFNADGTLDTAFGTNGLASYRSQTSTYIGRRVEVTADGKILVSGETGGSYVTVRFLASGVLDPSFFVNSNVFGKATDLLVQADGKIVRAGYSESFGSVYMMRLLADGGVDTAFGSNGVYQMYTSNGSATLNCLAVQADGKILFGGKVKRSLSQGGYGVDMYVCRLTTSGVLDTTFGSSGWAYISGRSNATYESAEALAVDGLGYIWVVGQSGPGEGNDVLLARLKPTGVLDTTFSGDGLLPTHLGGASSMPTDLVLDASGRILISGYASVGHMSSAFVVRRYLDHGGSDLSFGTDGLVKTSFGLNPSEANALALQEDGKILVAGTAVESGTVRGLAVARLNPGPPLPPPVITITKPPVSQTLPYGTAVNLSVEAEGNVPITYIWYRNGTEISRADHGTLSVYLMYSTAGPYQVRLQYGTYFVLSDVVQLSILSQGVDTPPVISMSFNKATGLVGQSKGLWVSLSGKKPLTCNWYKGSELVKSETGNLASTSLTVGPLTTADEGNYHVVVSNTMGEAVSGDILLEVKPDPWVELPLSQIVIAGEPASIWALILSSGEAGVQWNKSGVPIKDARGSDYLISSAKLSDAGLYTLSVRTLKTSAESEVTRLTVVDVMPGAPIVVPSGKKYEMVAKVAGPDLTFSWHKDGQAILPNERMSGLDSQTLTFLNPEVGDGGVYTCQFSIAGSIGETGPQRLTFVTGVPVLAGLDLPSADAGIYYNHALVLPAEISHLEITGLPPGLTYTKTGNRLTGDPGKPGTYPLKVRAVNVLGKSASLTVPFIVNEMRNGAEGRFYGSVTSDYGETGIFDMTISPNGAYSGKVLLSSLTKALQASASFTGAIMIDNGVAGENPVPEWRSSSTTMALGGLWTVRGKAAFAFDVGGGGILGGAITVPIKFPAGGGDSEVMLRVSATRCPWRADHSIEKALQGTFNVSLAGGGPPGMGYAQAVVSPAGNLTVAGKLPDNTAILQSAPIDKDRKTLAMTCLYGNRGRLYMEYTLRAGASGPDGLDALVDGSGHWIKEPTTPPSGSNYPEGFSGGASMYGAKYLPPNFPILTSSLAMNFRPGVNNAAVTMFGMGGQATLKANHKIEFPAGEALNPAGFSTISFAPATGLFTGTGVYQYDEERVATDGSSVWVRVKKPFTLQGLAVRPPNRLSATGMGFSVISMNQVVSYDPYRLAVRQVSFPIEISPPSPTP